MLSFLLFTLILLCCHTNALVTVLCNTDDACSGCPFIQAGCVLYDNGQLQLAKQNTYPATYQSGGFDGNGYHVEFYFGGDSSASISTPNGSGVSKMRPANSYPAYLYFAFNDKSEREAANDARSACFQMLNWGGLALPCDGVYNEALSVYKPN